MELKVIFLEIVYLDLYSDKVWGFSIFSFYTAPGDIYGRPLLSTVQVYVDLFTNLYNGIFIQKNIRLERSPMHIHLRGKPASLLIISR